MESVTTRALRGETISDQADDCIVVLIVTTFQLRDTMKTNFVELTYIFGRKNCEWKVPLPPLQALATGTKGQRVHFLDYRE